jgi:hypothetical protein
MNQYTTPTIELPPDFDLYNFQSAFFSALTAMFQKGASNVASEGAIASAITNAYAIALEAERRLAPITSAAARNQATRSAKTVKG